MPENRVSRQNVSNDTYSILVHVHADRMPLERSYGLEPELSQASVKSAKALSLAEEASRHCEEQYLILLD